MPPLPKTCPKMVLSHKEGSLCVKTFLQKNFLVSGEIPRIASHSKSNGEGRHGAVLGNPSLEPAVGIYRGKALPLSPRHTIDSCATASAEGPSVIVSAAAERTGRNLLHLRIGHLSGGNGWSLLVLLEVLSHCRSRDYASEYGQNAQH